MRLATLNALNLFAGPLHRRLPLALCVALVALLSVSSLHSEQARPKAPLRMIGATAIVTEASSGLPFQARVDTGATTCSIHCETMEIENASDDGHANVGKSIRFLVNNKKGQSEWVKAKIVDYAEIRTSERADWRYKVKLRLRYHDVEKNVLVTLNDRKHMKFPMLLGRNYLRNTFLVNVSWDDQQARSQMASGITAVVENKSVDTVADAP